MRKVHIMLQLENVCFTYKSGLPNAVDGFSYTFSEDKTYGITGKSGSGKTTLISLIAGMDKPTSGSISYRGQNLEQMNLSHYRARNIGVIFQSYNLLLKWTALDNVMISLSLAGAKRDEVRHQASELLETVGIDKVKQCRTILQLSGGEQQRVAIARALAGNPDIIIADEPTGNLDEENSNVVFSILDDIAHKNGKCVIIVTHDNSLADRCDERICLNEGKIT